MDPKDFFVPKEEKAKLIQIYQGKEIGVLIGMPTTGKTRLIKSIVRELEILDQYAFIDLKVFQHDDFDPLKFTEFTSNLYNQGKRLFFFEGLNLDSPSATTILDLIENHYLSVIDRFCIILSITCLPELYKESYKLNKILFNNNLLIDTQSEYFINNNYQNLMERENYVLSEDEISITKKLTGNIPSLVKFAIKQFKNNINPEENLEDSYPELNNILNLLTDKEVIGLRLLSKNKKADITTMKSLQSTGFIDESNKIKSSLLQNYIQKFYKEYQVNVYNNKVFLNSIEITEKFTIKELSFLTQLKLKSKLSREEIFYLITNEKNLEKYSDLLIEKFVSRLREKFELHGINKSFIKTLNKQGYKL
jgi:hypothetical protein